MEWIDQIVEEFVERLDSRQRTLVTELILIPHASEHQVKNYLRSYGEDGNRAYTSVETLRETMGIEYALLQEALQHRLLH